MPGYIHLLTRRNSPSQALNILRSNGLGGQPQEGARRYPISPKASDRRKGASGNLKRLSDQRCQSVERRRFEDGLVVLVIDQPLLGPPGGFGVNSGLIAEGLGGSGHEAEERDVVLRIGGQALIFAAHSNRRISLASRKP